MKKICFILISFVLVLATLTSCSVIPNIYSSYDEDNKIFTFQYVKEFDENWEYYNKFDSYEKIYNLLIDNCKDCDFDDVSYNEKTLMISNDENDVYIIIIQGDSLKETQDLFWAEYYRMLIRNYQYFMFIKIGNCIIEAIRENSCEIVKRLLNIDVDGRMVDSRVQYFNRDSYFLYSNEEFLASDWIDLDGYQFPKKIKKIIDKTNCTYHLQGSSALVMEKENGDGIIESMGIYPYVLSIEKKDLPFGYLFEFKDCFVFTNSYYFANIINSL